MDLFYSQDQTEGFVVRITNLNCKDPSFLRNKLMVYARFRGFMGKLSLTLHGAVHDEWVESVRSIMPSYGNLHPFEAGVYSESFLDEARYGFEETPVLDSEIDSMVVNSALLRKLGYTALMVQGEGEQSVKKYVIHFIRMSDCARVMDIAQRARAESFGEFLIFEHRALLFNQRIFLNDKKRLGAYKKIFRDNPQDFKDKVVLDVGCGLGILSLFAAGSSPRVIYAVEPCVVALNAENVVKENQKSDIIKVFHGSVESLELPSKVDVIISDDFGEMLLHGQMLRNLLIAKQRFLKPGGKLYPAAATLILRPAEVSDYDDMLMKDFNDWGKKARGRGLLSARISDEAIGVRFSRPMIRTKTEDRGIATSHEQLFDFATLTPEKLQQIDFPFFCTVLKNAVVKAFTFTFKLSFHGVESRYILDAGNDGEPTRWQNVYCLLRTPLNARAAETIKGTCRLFANEFHSYDIEMNIHFRRGYYEYKYRLEYDSSIAKSI